MTTMNSSTDIQKKYKMLSQISHVLLRPDTYIGSIEKHTETKWKINEESTKCLQAQLSYVPGLYKLGDELLVNAWDAYIRNRNNPNDNVKSIDFSINQETGRITVTNTGRGIDICQLSEYDNIYTVEMIFGKLLTSTNYNENEEKVTGGKNGFGAKLANIYSIEFEVETIDTNTQQKYRQKWTENMGTRYEPEITPYKKKNAHTSVSFIPDFKRFNMTGWTPDFIEIFKKRTFEVAACCGTKVKVSFNGIPIETNTFHKFCLLFSDSLLSSRQTEDGTPVPPQISYEKVNDRWEYGLGISEGFQQVSFVNGICTAKGGKHVDYIMQIICKKIADYIQKKNKIEVKTQYIREHIFLFVNCLIVNPSFDSQTKDYLTTQPSKFGSKCDVSDKIIEAFAKNGLIDRVIETYNFKESKLLKKNDGKKTKRLLGIPKLDDANEAGGKRSLDCTLIVTEGESARSMAIAGLEIVGRDLYGVFPLKGKVINVREKLETKAGREQVSNNAELNYLKQIIGLEHGLKYDKTDNIKRLRYGHLLIMTDQDTDGSHIKGLIMNLFDVFWPELLEVKGFIQCMATPIIKAFKGKNQISFYTLKEYADWKNKKLSGWHTKYYKGLGTSTSNEAKEYFKSLKKTSYIGERDDINMAFHKDLANKRKEWLKTYSPNEILDSNNAEITYSDFVNKELIHFSNYDVQRSIPHIMDGQKPSQRKILFGCFKRNLTKEIRVAQLAGYISENAAYHHGEESLNKAIIAMAQDFTGSNNINLLLPNGQFGTRYQNGKDSGSPRYLHTALSPITKYIFNPHDDPCLEYLDDDGQKIEPKWYLPIIPLILCNGTQGIGTGYSTSVPLYNPKDVISYIEYKIHSLETPNKSFARPKMTPYYNGFRGTIINSEDGVLFKGNYSVKNYKTLVIEELPIGTSIDAYKTWLDESLVETQNASSKKKESKSNLFKYVKHYVSQSTETTPHFEIELEPSFLSELRITVAKENKSNNLVVNTIEKLFKLTSRISTSNMHLYNTDGIIQKYETVYDIADTFFENRFPVYQERKNKLVSKISEDMSFLENKVKFIKSVVENRLDVRNHTKHSLEAWLSTENFKKKDDNYHYLITIPIYTLTTDTVDNLKEKVKAFNNINTKTIWQMWLDDLDKLKKNLNI